MAVITIDTAATGLVAPRKGDAPWAKLARAKRDIDLTQDRTKAWSTPYIRWGNAVAAEPGSYIIAGESGMYAGYVLLEVMADGKTLPIPGDLIQWEVEQSGLPDEVRAKAINSRPYMMAAYAWLRLEHSTAPEAETRSETPGPARTVEQVWQSIQQLSDEERADLLGRLLKEM